MTEAELILVDYALERIPVGQAFNIQGPLHNATIGMYDKYSGDLLKEITDIVLYKEITIRNILLAEGYTQCVDHSRYRDILTDKGKIAQQQGGHLQYKEWEKKEKSRAKLEDFPKKKWYIFEPIKTVVNWAIVFALGVIVGYFVGHSNSPTNSQATPKQVQPAKTNAMPVKTAPKKDTISKVISH